MDPADKQINDLEIKILKQRFNSLPDDSSLFKPAWVRRLIQSSNEYDRFLLAYGFDFLWRCAIISWVLFIVQKIS
jgi:hypothetical protein